MMCEVCGNIGHSGNDCPKTREEVAFINNAFRQPQDNNGWNNQSRAQGNSNFNSNYNLNQSSLKDLCAPCAVPTGMGKANGSSGTPNHMRPMCGANPSSPFLPLPWRLAEARRCGGAPSVRASWPSRPSILPHVSLPRGHRANHITLPVPGPAAARRRTPRTRERPYCS